MIKGINYERVEHRKAHLCLFLGQNDGQERTDQKNKSSLLTQLTDSGLHFSSYQ